MTSASQRPTHAHASGLLAKPGVLALLAGILGLAIGLSIGWATVKVANTTPATLRSDLQADYLSMVIQSFRVNLDPSLALRRWQSLGPAAEPLLADLHQHPGLLNPTVIDGFDQVVHVLKSAADPASSTLPAATFAGVVILVLVFVGEVGGMLLSRLLRNRPPAPKIPETRRLPASPLPMQLAPAAAAGALQAPSPNADRPLRHLGTDGIGLSVARIAAAITAFSRSAGWKLIRYILARASMILITIFIGTFITVLLANQGGQIDKVVQSEVDLRMDGQYPGWRWRMVNSPPDEQALLKLQQAGMAHTAGLDLPYWPRQMAWTIKALRLDWQAPVKVSAAPGSDYPSHRVVDIILTDLPHTLLLVGASFLLLFLVGIPMALYLFRKQGSRLDRFISLLAPLSSIPSWVLGVIMVTVFAVQLRILPVGGMYDAVTPQAGWQRLLVVVKHMILPVLAILISLLFQCVYTWRSFFLLYAEEDYVELAYAKGLPNSLVERRYVLQPTLPYILTNFTLLLIGFWQMTIALEKILNWPGIGRLYIITLPNFFGDSFYPGVMPITLGIVVIFAYLLGLTVLILELSYAVVDPQIRLGNDGPTLREPSAPTGRRTWFWQRKRASQPIGGSSPDVLRDTPSSRGWEKPARSPVPLSARLRSFIQSLDSLKPIWHELSRSPTAMFGLIVITILVVSSIYAVTAYPYNKLVDIWYMKALSGKIYVPRLASPEWVNFFRKDKLPTSIILDSHDPSVTKTVVADANGTGKVTITYTVNYPYADFPQDILLYFDPAYIAKQPFAQLTWITPDGRQIDAGRTGAIASTTYSFNERISTQRLLAQNKPWQSWFTTLGNAPTPRVDLLFADPAKEQPVIIPGAYQLRIDGTTFEPGSTLDAQFVLLGQVYGVAGTDNMRRDLIVPLLWGMPFALVFGLLGAFVTTILSMTLAAMAAWYGGWLDDLIQRLVEANMVLPIIAIGVLIYAYFNVSIWVFLGIVVILNVFASPTKSFRAAFLQVRNAPYIEAARAYGATDARIILRYLVPRILPMFIPQLVTLIPSYVFLEATLGIFNVRSDYPTWGRTIYDALRYGSHYGSSYWVLEPLSLLLLTGLAFAMFGFALEKVLNPRTTGRG